MDDFRLKRKMVEETVLKTLRLALSGSCCPACCFTNCPTIRQLSCGLPECDLDWRNCSKGHHVDLRYFQMGKVVIPDEVTSRYMRRAVLQIEAEREFFIQDRAVKVKNTTMQIQQLHNEAKELTEVAKAQGRLILAKAEASRDSLLQRSYQAALKKTFKELNVTKEQDKLSFVYLRALEKNKDNLLAFNYVSQTAVTP